MIDLIQNITEYWYLWIALVVLIPVLIFAMIKASKAAKKRNEIIRKQEEEFQRIKDLAKKYGDISKEKAIVADAKELAEGITAVLQFQLEKSENPDELFENSEAWQKTVYSLFYFDEDVKTSLSFFFKHNGGPVPKIAVEGISLIDYGEINSYVREMFAMYDDNNEAASLDMNRVEVLDEKFNAHYSNEEFFAKVKVFIINSI